MAGDGVTSFSLDPPTLMMSSPLRSHPHSHSCLTLSSKGIYGPSSEFPFSKPHSHNHISGGGELNKIAETHLPDPLKPSLMSPFLVWWIWHTLSPSHGSQRPTLLIVIAAFTFLSIYYMPETLNELSFISTTSLWEIVNPMKGLRVRAAKEVTQSHTTGKGQRKH